MKKGIFLVVGFIIGAILYYLATMFYFYDVPIFENWSGVDRLLWLFFGGLASLITTNSLSLFMWDFYYHLDDKK